MCLSFQILLLLLIVLHCVKLLIYITAPPADTPITPVYIQEALLYLLTSDKKQ